MNAHLFKPGKHGACHLSSWQKQYGHLAWWTWFNVPIAGLVVDVAMREPISILGKVYCHLFGAQCANSGLHCEWMDEREWWWSVLIIGGHTTTIYCFLTLVLIKPSTSASRQASKLINFDYGHALVHWDCHWSVKMFARSLACLIIHSTRQSCRVRASARASDEVLVSDGQSSKTNHMHHLQSVCWPNDGWMVVAVGEDNVYICIVSLRPFDDSVFTLCAHHNGVWVSVASWSNHYHSSIHPPWPLANYIEVI